MTILLVAHNLIPNWAADCLEFLGNHPGFLYLFVASTIGLIVLIKIFKRRR